MSAEPYNFDADAWAAGADDGPDHPTPEPPPEECRRCGRDSCSGDCGYPRHVARGAALRPAPEFLAECDAAGEIRWLCQDLIPEEGIVVWHGRPRAGKSLASLEVAAALALGTPAFHADRFAVPEPVAVAYIAEEDPARVIGARLRMLLAGRGLQTTQAPSGLYLCARAGWNLETPGHQAELVDVLTSCPVPPRVLMIDPARASLPSLDGGPKDAAPAVGFLRALMRETSVRTILLNHHDTKPGRDGKDERGRAERASGGVTFSIADAPVGFTRVDEREFYAEPNAYKFAGDPKGFRIRAESETEAPEPFRGFLRLVAESRTLHEQESAAVERAVLADLEAADDWKNTAAIRQAVNRRAELVSAALARLTDDGKIVRREAGRAKEYRLGMNP